MSDYDTFYLVGPKESKEAPPCAVGREHCWHQAGSFGIGGTGLHYGVGFSELCCWCGLQRQRRPNPDAHGPHDPRKIGMRAYYAAG